MALIFYTILVFLYLPLKPNCVELGLRAVCLAVPSTMIVHNLDI